MQDTPTFALDEEEKSNKRKRLLMVVQIFYQNYNKRIMKVSNRDRDYFQIMRHF